MNGAPDNLTPDELIEWRINHYDESRPLSNGQVKNTLTGEAQHVDDPTDKQNPLIY